MKKIYALLIILVSFSYTEAQTVTNSRFEQEGKMVKIYYDLSEDADISIYLSTDGGITFESQPIGHVTGAVGKGVAAGKGKCAVWDVLSDRDKLQGDKVLFKVIAYPNAEHCYKMGENYYYGRNGVANDYAEAVKWYRKAAEQGHAKAQCKLGYMYYNGYGVAKDYAEAVKWYRKAAEQGNATAQCNLGNMYRDGYGVAKDYAEALKLYRKAADQGNAGGQNGLGYMYHMGYGVAKDYAEAVKWYRKSAEQGNAYAQYCLGLCYQYGTGVPKDISEARRWYKKAADQGYKNAEKQLREL